MDKFRAIALNWLKKTKQKKRVEWKWAINMNSLKNMNSSSNHHKTDVFSVPGRMVDYSCDEDFQFEMTLWDEAWEKGDIST